jgi:hypothetical protein
MLTMFLSEVFVGGTCFLLVACLVGGALRCSKEPAGWVVLTLPEAVARWCCSSSIRGSLAVDVVVVVVEEAFRGNVDVVLVLADY